VVFALVCIALLLKHHERSTISQRADNDAQPQHNSTQVRAPSSRWGHRFDDDDFAELTPEEKEAEMGNWEDFEMEVANVLVDSSSHGWDINSKTGGQDDNNDVDDENDIDDGYTDHWVQYYDKSSEQYYFFHRETNTTQWEKPEVVEGVVLLGIAHGTGREYIIEGGDVVDGYDSEVDMIAEKSNNASLSEDTPTSMDVSDLNQFDRADEVFAQYKDTMWRWNHPYRLPESFEVRKYVSFQSVDYVSFQSVYQISTQSVSIFARVGAELTRLYSGEYP
jgi:hypothetical protein